MQLDGSIMQLDVLLLNVRQTISKMETAADNGQK